MVNLKRYFRIFIFPAMLSAFLFSGCATKKVSEQEASVLVIDSKARVINKANNESHNVNIKVTYEPESRIRMSVSGLLGVQAADLVMTREKIVVANHLDKLFVEGPFRPETFKSLFREPVDPRLFWMIVHGKDIADGVYNGTFIKTEMLGKKDSFQKRKIELKNNNIEIIWILQGREGVKFENSTSQNKTFDLKKPASYKWIEIK